MADWIALVSSVAAVASVVIALVALRYSRAAVRATLDQASAATSANQFAKQVGQSEAVIHFTGRFFDLMNDGPKFGDTKWEYHFWSLLATEFYFFENSWVPDFMFQLWMVELTSMYYRVQVRESHRSYLRHYSGNYGRMCDFFSDLQDIAQRSNDDAATRHRKVAEIVDKWEKTHVQ